MKWNNNEEIRARHLRNTGRTYNTIAMLLTNEFGREFTFDGVRNKLRRSKEETPESSNGNIPHSLQNSQEERITSVNRGADGNIDTTFAAHLTQNDLQDDRLLLEKSGLDPDKYEIINVKTGNWEQNSNEKGITQLHSVKITARKIVGITDSAFAEELIKENVEPVIVKQSDDFENENTRNLVIPLADMHFGITQIEDLEDKLSNICKIIKKGYYTIVIEQLGDLFHSSLMKSSQTQKGTQLDDVDMVKAINDAKEFFDIILELAIENSSVVEIRHTEGNHSGNMEYMFLIYLEARYPQVDVYKHDDFRTAYMLGDVAIMIAHGDYARKNLPMLFANEYSEYWGEGATREIHTGHFHSEKTVDHDGVIHRQLGTVKPNDKYEISNGWTMNKKEIQLLEYDYERLRVTYNI